MVEEQSSPVSLPAREMRSGTRATAGLSVFAATAGAVSSLPIPFLDRRLVMLVRGAAFRRVARLHGVRISSEARRVLVAPSHGSFPPLARRLVGRLVTRAFRSVRAAGRLEEGVRTWSDSVLLDHYLASGRRTPGAPLLEGEAIRVKSAMASAAVTSVLGLLQDSPVTLPGALRRAIEAVWNLDAEDRTPLERGVDALLDAAADVPLELVERLSETFDSALAEAHVSRRD